MNAPAPAKSVLHKAISADELDRRFDEGEDVSAAFVAGAQIAERLVQQHGIRIAVLKARSPSCGNQQSPVSSVASLSLSSAR